MERFDRMRVEMRHIAGKKLPLVKAKDCCTFVLLSLLSPVASSPAADASVVTPAPANMVWIPGGEFLMGCDEAGDALCSISGVTRDALPIHKVYVDGFWMDRTEVTNDQFEKFTKATGYVTIAERVPTKEEFPTAPPENLVAGSVVFAPPDHDVPLNNHYQWWSYVKGANWRHPLGAESDIKGKEKYPVVHVSYPDAEAYAKWASKRLPTEAEFEFAERGGLEGKTYAWGDELRP